MVSRDKDRNCFPGREATKLFPRIFRKAGVAKSVNAGDLKSPGSNPLRVQFPPPALDKYLTYIPLRQITSSRLPVRFSAWYEALVRSWYEPKDALFFFATPPCTIAPWSNASRDLSVSVSREPDVTLRGQRPGKMRDRTRPDPGTSFALSGIAHRADANAPQVCGHAAGGWWRPKEAVRWLCSLDFSRPPHGAGF